MIELKFHEKDNAALVREMGRRFKQYRISYRLTQQDVADQTGISKVTLSNFENGKLNNLTLAHFMGLMRVLDRLDWVDNLLPEIPISAYELDKIQKKQKKRVRYKNNINSGPNL